MAAFRDSVEDAITFGLSRGVLRLQHRFQFSVEDQVARIVILGVGDANYLFQPIQVRPTRRI
jgi:hypothetical protein